MNNFTNCSEKGNKVESKQGRFSRALRACTMVAAMLLMVAGISLDAAAQSVKSCAVKKAPSVSMTLKGGMPQSAKVQATKVDRSTSNGKHVYGAYDITITNGTAEWQPAGGAPVMVSITDPNFADGTLLDVYHEGANGNEFVATVSPTNHTITFPAHSFSVYIVTETGETGGNARLTVHFVQANGAEKVIYVKKNDIDVDDNYEMFNRIVYDPGAGSYDHQTLVFRGWKKAAANYTYTVNDANGAFTIADIRSDIETTLNAGVQEGDEVYYYALLYKSAMVTYIDENGIGLGSDNNLMLPTQSNVAYTVFKNYTPPSSDQNLEGWHIYSGDNNISAQNGTLSDPIPQNTPVLLTGDVVLSANAPHGKWLVFDQNGKGADYNAPQFVKTGQVTVRPNPDPERFGYTFDDWYTIKYTDQQQAAPANKFQFSQTLTADKTIYAHWIPNTTANYTVIIWKQKVEGDGYDFETVITLNGTVGNTINTVSQQGGNGNNAYARINGTDYQYQGFHLKNNGYDQNVTIVTEGTSVVNVYYDRTEYTLTFRRYANSGTVYKTITARYQAPIGDQFPISVDGTTDYRWEPHNSSTFNQVLVYVDIMPAENVTFSRNSSNASTKYMEFYVEALPGQTADRNFDGKSFVKYGNTIPAKYNFFTEAEDFVELAGYDKYGSDPAFSNGQANVSGGGTIRFYYTRKEYSINYMDGVYVRGDENGNPVDETNRNQLLEVDDISYGANLSSYNKGGANFYNPTFTGYAFEGWYVDKACTQPYTFTTMPDGGITVYAKWRMNQYRVFLHSLALGDESVYWGGDQKTNFRVYYGEKVANVHGERDYYEFVGWFKDALCTQAFSVTAYSLNDEITVPYNKNVDMTDESNIWGDPNDDGTYTTNSDATGFYGGDRFWITRKLDLYAGWRKTIEGAKGIHIVYDPGSGSNPPSDSRLYLDQTAVIAGSAPTADQDSVFSYWDVQKWSETENKFVPSGVHVFPGGQFTAILDDAHHTQITNPTDPEVTDKYTIQLIARYVPLEVHTPTFIVWYDNYTGDTLRVDGKIDPNDETDTHAELHINQAVDIVAAPSRDGYIFKGWFKYNFTGQPGQQPTTLTKTLLPDSNLCVPNFLNYANNAYTSAKTGAATQVAADEANPYDYLYAIWEPVVEFETPITYCQGDEASLPTPTSPSDITLTWTLNNQTVITVNTETADTFIYTWTTSDGCKTGDVSVVVNAKPTVELTNVSVCSGDDVTLTPTNVSTDVTSYSWVNNPGENDFTEGATPAAYTQENVTEGFSKTITVKNANGCIATATAQVTVNALPTVTLSAVNKCSGEAATVTATSETATSYSWDGGTTWGTTNSQSFTEVGDHQVSVKVKDNNNCVSEAATAQVTVNALPTVTLEGDEVCATANGTFTFSPVVTPEGTYTYKWDNDEEFGNTSTKSESTVTPGQYTHTVSVKSENGCVATANATLVVKEVSPAEITGTDAFCSGSETQLSVAAAEGASYAWTKDDEAFGTNSNSITVTEAGTYKVTVTSADGCLSNGEKTVTVWANPTIDPTVTNATCVNDDGEVELAITTDNNVSYTCAYEYVTPASTHTKDFTNINTNKVTGLDTATYKVTVTDVNGCKSTANFKIDLNNNLDVTVSGETKHICSGGSFTVNPTTELTDVKYSWSEPSQQGGTVGGTAAGDAEENVHGENLTNDGTTGVVLTYTVTPTLGICVGTPEDVTVEVGVTVHPVPSITAEPVTVCPNAKTVDLSATFSSVEATVDTVIWTLMNGTTQMATATHTTHNGVTTSDTWSPADLTFECGKNYTYNIVYKDAYGCKSEGGSTVEAKVNGNITFTGETVKEVSCVSDVVAPHEATPSLMPVAKDGCGQDISAEAANGGAGWTLKTSPTAVACEGTMAYVYEYKDCSGNTKDWTFTYTIKMEDFTMPADGGTTIHCAADLAEPELPEVKDACGKVLTASEPEISETPECDGTVTYKYTYTDCAQHSHVWTYTYTIEKPILTFTNKGLTDIENVNSCYSENQAGLLKTNDDVKDMYSSNCDKAIEVTSEDAAELTNDCSWKITRTFTITDGCNTEEKTQSVSGGDKTAPTFTAPAAKAICRNEDGTYTITPEVTGNVTDANDNCTTISNNHISYSDATPVQNDNGTLTIVRTWKVTDDCGNYTEHDQTITVNPLPTITATPATQIIVYGNSITPVEITNEYSTVALSQLPTGFAYNENNQTVTAQQPVVGEYSITATATSNQEPACGTAQVTITVIVNQDQSSITIASSTNEWKYDGQTHFDPVYTVTYAEETLTADEGSDGKVFTLPTGDKVTITPTSQGVKNYNASYANNNTYTYVVDHASSYSNISSTIGTLSITKRDVTLTSADDTKVYDGTALTNNTVTVSGDGFVEGEGATFTVTGTQTAVGNSANTFTYALNEGTLAGNYEITMVEGTLTVTENKTPIVITSGDNEWKYDGANHTEETYTVKYGEQTITADATGKVFTLPTGDKVTISNPASVKNVGDTEEENNTYSYTVDNQTFYTSITANYGNLTITPRTVVMTSADGEKVYDGQPLTKNAQTDVTVTGDGFVTGEGATYDITGSQTNVGESENTFTYTLNEGTLAENYTITTANGTLKVTPLAITVTITGNNSTDLYDGTEHTVEGYVAEASSELYNVENDIEFTGEATASRTDAGTTNMNLATTQFSNTNDNFTVTFTVTDGYQTVNKRSVVLTSASAEQEYNGNDLVRNAQTDVAVTGDGFAEGEGAVYDITGKQRLVGSSENTFTYTLNENTKADNYTIETVFGTLTVTDRTEKYPIEVVSNSETVTYDGEEHTAEGFETLSFTTVDGNDYTVEGLTATVTKTDAGTYDNTITGTPVVKDEDGNDVTAQFDVTLVNGKLVINPANLVIELDSTKIYDGTKFVVSYEQLHVTGLVSRDHITGGTVTSEDYVVGVYRCEEGGFQLMNVEGVAVKEGFAIDNGLGNYVPKFNVTLRIVEREITVTAHSASKSFDGTALTEDGYDTENVAEGDAVAVTITGEQICMGTSANVPSDAVITRTADNDRDVTDSYIVNYVNGTLTVTEAEAGAFTCPEAETKTMKDCELTMTVTVEGEPTVDGIAEGSYTVENNLAELNPMSEGVHEITWTMKDNCGNVVASCTQTVTLQYGECTGTAGYEAVRIGSQCWMKENLKEEVGTYKAYKDDNANLEKFGYLYTWYTAMGLEEGDDSTDPWANAPTDACGNPYVQGICPEGWAVGSDADYALLGATAGDASFLKDPSTEYWLPEKAGVVEGNLGFNARGGGWYNSTLGDFEDIYAAFRYWTPDSEPGAYATSGSINYFCGTPQTLTNKKSDMMSVRCIRKVQPNE